MDVSEEPRGREHDEPRNRRARLRVHVAACDAARARAPRPKLSRIGFVTVFRSVTTLFLAGLSVRTPARAPGSPIGVTSTPSSAPDRKVNDTLKKFLCCAPF